MGLRELIRKKERTYRFTVDPQQELAHNIVTGRLLEQILDLKLEINRKICDLQQKVEWAILFAKKTATMKKLIIYMNKNITYIDALIHVGVLPFICPKKKDTKYRAVRGYSKIYTASLIESWQLLRELEDKRLREQRTLMFQRIIFNYAIYVTMAKFLDGISPDPDFVKPSRDKIYVLPQPQTAYGGQFGFGAATPTSGGRQSGATIQRRPTRPEEGYEEYQPHKFLGPKEER